MPFTVGSGGKSEVTNETLEWAYTTVGPHMADQRALICTGVHTKVTLVWRESQMCPDMRCKEIIHSLII
jgi:hypothetical protein